MYIFGADIPLVEIVLFLFVVDLIILIFLFFYMIKVKKMDQNNRRLSKTLLKLEDRELEELKQIRMIKSQAGKKKPVKMGRPVKASKTHSEQVWNKIVNFVIDQDTPKKSKRSEKQAKKSVKKQAKSSVKRKAALKKAKKPRRR